MDTIIWKTTTEERYFDMLGVLPPALQTGYGFLVGEPYSHRRCTETHKIAPTFMAFRQHGDDFFEASEPLTVAEFEKQSPHVFRLA